MGYAIGIFSFIKFIQKTLSKVLYGEASPWGPTPYPFKYHFWQKVPHLPSIRQMVPLSDAYLYITIRYQSLSFNWSKVRLSSFLDCIFEIYKLSKLIVWFLKTFSRTEVINKGVLLNRMLGTYNTALANVSFFVLNY